MKRYRESLELPLTMIVAGACTLLGCGTPPPAEEVGPTTQNTAQPDTVAGDGASASISEASEAPPAPGPEPVEPVTETVSFDAMHEGTVGAGAVTVQGILHEIHEATACDGDGECVPCVAMTSLKHPSGKYYGKRIHVEGVPEGFEDMTHLVPYTFVVEVGDAGEPNGSPCEPDGLRYTLVECLDCGEDKIPNMTLDEFAAYDGPAVYVEVEAIVTDYTHPGPCPPKHKCEPCSNTTRLSNGKQGDENVTILVIGHPPKPKKLVKSGAKHVFLLELGEDWSAAALTCDPRFNTVRLQSCTDCPD